MPDLDLGPEEELEDEEAQPDQSTEPSDDDDADASDDDGGQDEDPDDDGDEDPAGDDEGQTRQTGEVGRGSGRGKTSQARLRERAQRAERNERELRERLDRLERQQNQQAQQPAETPAQRAERFSLMSPEERAAEIVREGEERVNRRLFMAEFRAADAADKADFRAMAREQPALAKVADEVERLLAEERNQGRNPSRQVVAYFVLGRRAVERAGRAGTKQRKQADTERQRQKARPGAARSDTGRGSGRLDDAAARRKRLEDVTF